MARPFFACCWAYTCADSAKVRASAARTPGGRSGRPSRRSAEWSWVASASRSATSRTCSPCTASTTNEERARLILLARNANTQGWWHRYGDVLPGWFQSYLGLEAAAAVIRTYEVQFVPGLLQTDEYARAVIRLGHSRARNAEIERRVSLRVARQLPLTRANPPQLWAVVDEAVLRRPIGGIDVMRAQVEALLEAITLPNVRLQVVPFHVGGHAGAGGAFTILRFPDEDLPDVVYIEQLTSSLYLDKRDDVDHYAEAMERLCDEAPPPDRTAVQRSHPAAARRPRPIEAPRSPPGPPARRRPATPPTSGSTSRAQNREAVRKQHRQRSGPNARKRRVGVTPQRSKRFLTAAPRCVAAAMVR